MKRALLLDRDGTLMVDQIYAHEPARVELLPHAAAVLRPLQDHFLLIVISNQSGIGRGLITHEQVRAVNDRMAELFAAEGVRFTDSFYCPHGPDDGCPCRKPAPGLILQAAAAHALDLPASIMIGDRPTDLGAAHAAGVGHAFQLDPDGESPDWLAIQQRIAPLV